MTPIVCGADCSGTIPAIVEQVCGVKYTRKGGICRFLFVTCKAHKDLIASDTLEEPIVDLDGNINLDKWTPMFEDCFARISNELNASKPVGSYTKARTSSCGGEEVTGKTVSIAFEDFVGYDDDSHLEWWNAIQASSRSLLVYYWKADNPDRPFGPFRFNIEVDDDVPNDPKELSKVTGTIIIENGGQIEGSTLLIGLQELALEYQSVDCAGGSGS